jgi:hypothetical protein
MDNRPDHRHEMQMALSEAPVFMFVSDKDLL